MSQNAISSVVVNRESGSQIECEFSARASLTFAGVYQYPRGKRLLAMNYWKLSVSVGLIATSSKGSSTTIKLFGIANSRVRSAYYEKKKKRWPIGRRQFGRETVFDRFFFLRNAQQTFAIRHCPTTRQQTLYNNLIGFSRKFLFSTTKTFWLPKFGLIGNTERQSFFEIQPICSVHSKCAHPIRQARNWIMNTLISRQEGRFLSSRHSAPKEAFGLQSLER